MTNSLFRVFNVKNYGAKGDGVHDDAPSIERAFRKCRSAGGGIVYYPTGTYGIYRTVSFSSEYPTFHCGQGRDQTTIKALTYLRTSKFHASKSNPFKSGSSGPKQKVQPAFNMFSVGRGPGAHIFSNMTIDGNRESFSHSVNCGTGNGIFFECNQQPNLGNSVRNVLLTNHHSCGVYSLGDPGNPDQQYERVGRMDHEIVIERCSFTSIGRRAVLLANISGGGVWDCNINFAGGSMAAITVRGGKNFAIARNTINNAEEPTLRKIANGRTGILVGASDNYSIVSNTVKNASCFGINASGGVGIHPPAALMSRRFICTDNIVLNSGKIGIVIDPHYCPEVELPDCPARNTTPVGQWGIIANNNVDKTGSNNGISIQQAKHMMIIGNTVKDARINGINLGNSSHCTVVGNTVTNAGNWGVGINATGSLLPVGYHYIGDDNISTGARGGFQIHEDTYHTNIRYPGHVDGAPAPTVAEQFLGAKIYGVENEYYVVVDDSGENIQTYICQKLANAFFDWIEMQTII